MKKTLAVLFTFTLIFSIIYSAEVSASPTFSGGIPAGWTEIGNVGTDGADGVVTLAPGSTTPYGYVSTDGGVMGAVLPGLTGTSNGNGQSTNGSILRTSVFTATAGTSLNFYFNFVTSDGAGWADYGWARLLDPSLNQVALLFTARTTPGGNSVPGFGMPAIAATMTPSTVIINPGGPVWSPLGGSSGKCFSTGCGYSGWVASDYTIANAGSYILEFGTANWGDTAWQTGLAFDGILVGGQPITPGVPEPATLLLLGFGLAGLATLRKKIKG
jgi:PEP-CTERM motif